MGTVKLPLLHPSAMACCGEGFGLFGVILETEKTLDIPAGMLGSHVDDLRPPFAMHTDGSSMEPSIPHGAIVVVNPADEILTGKVALVRTGSQVMIKRIQWRRDGGVDLLSDGMDTPTLSYEKEDLETGWVTLIGRVVGIYKPL